MDSKRKERIPPIIVVEIPTKLTVKSVSEQVLQYYFVTKFLEINMPQKEFLFSHLLQKW